MTRVWTRIELNLSEIYSDKPSQGQGSNSTSKGPTQALYSVTLWVTTITHLSLTQGLLGQSQSDSFTPDITPLMLAAHRDNYEIIKILLERGDRIPKPHNVQCPCKECIAYSNDDILCHSRLVNSLAKKLCLRDGKRCQEWCESWLFNVSRDKSFEDFQPMPMCPI